MRIARRHPFACCAAVVSTSCPSPRPRLERPTSTSCSSPPQQRWLLTFDLDFGELAFKRQIPLPPAIILVRASEDFTALVIDALTSEQAAEGGFFVLDGRGMRWRPFSP
jgi:hypothetical protein